MYPFSPVKVATFNHYEMSTYSFRVYQCPELLNAFRIKVALVQLLFTSCIYLIIDRRKLLLFAS